MKKFFIILFVIAGLAQWWFKNPSIGVASNDLSFSYMVKHLGDTSKNDTLPMLVALHGNGDTVENFYDSALDQFTAPMRLILLKGPISRSSRGSSWPWNATDFEFYGKAISEAVELLAAKFPTTDKPILLGFSGGGMMAYYQAVNYGDKYSYIFPVSGNLSYDQLGEEESNPGAPVHAFHGKSDSVVSFSGGKKAVKILEEQGVEVEFTVFKGGHHGIFIEMKSQITQDIEEKIDSLR